MNTRQLHFTRFGIPANTPLTDWVPSKKAPDLVGYYEVEAPGIHHRSKHYLTGQPFRYWNGEKWMTHSTGKYAVQSIFGSHPEHRWRGLKSKP